MSRPQRHSGDLSELSLRYILAPLFMIVVAVVLGFVLAPSPRQLVSLVSLMVGIGIPLGLTSVPAWHWLFGWLS